MQKSLDFGTESKKDQINKKKIKLITKDKISKKKIKLSIKT